MAGSTSGGISDLSLMMKLGIDQSSVTDSMKFVGDVQSKLAGLSDKLITLNLPQIQSEAFNDSQGILKGREEALDAAREKESKAGELARMGEYYRGLELKQEEKLKAAKLDAINQFSSALASEESRAKQRYETEAQRIDRLYQKRRDNIAALQAMPGDPMDQSEVDALNKRNNQQAKRESTNVVRGMGEDVDARAASRLSAEEKIDEWERKHISNIQSLTHLSQTQADLAQSRVAKEAEAERVHLQEINLKSTLLKITNDIAAAEQRDMTFAEQQAALAQQRLQAINEAYGKFSQLTTLQQQEKQAAIDAVKNENMRAVTYHEEVEDAKKLKSLNDAMERSHVGVMKPMERITHEYEKQKKLINEITVAGSAENKALHAKNDIIKAGTIARETERGNLSDVGGFSKAGTRIQEFGRGFEDFTVGFSMAKTNIEGIAMGLRGSANNAAQLAASFNPMVGAAVAIGASLATVIVPMVARWLWDTKELEKAQDAWNEKLKESGREQVKVAEAQAKMLADVRADAKKPKAEQGKGILENVRGLEEKATATKEGAELLKIQRDMSKQRLKDASAPLEKQKQEASDAAAALVTQSALADATAAAFGDSDAERRSEAANAALKETERQIEVETARVKKHDKELKDAADASVDAALALEAVKKKSAADIAKAETDIFNAEKDKQQQTLDAMTESELDNAVDKANRKRDIESQRIKSLNLNKPAEDALLVGAVIIRDQEVEEARKKDRAKQREDEEQFDAYMAEKTERDKKLMLEQWQDENDFAGYLADKKKAEEAKRLDDALLANEAKQEALQEQMEKSGNAAGPSAAMVSGTQAAESAINRALSGSQSVEGTMKAQLKELEKVNKNLEKQKRNIVASIT